MEVERVQKQRNESSRGWVAEQGKVLKTRYTAEKWEQVKASRKKAGLYYECEDFPGDDDDPWSLPLAVICLVCPYPSFDSTYMLAAKLNIL